MESLLIGCITFVNEMFRTGDEVREGVFLLEHFAVVVPGASHVGAAADVSDGEDKPTLQKAEAVGIKISIDHCTV